MKIDLTKHKLHHWFEDEEGNIYKAIGDDLPKDKPYYSYHCIHPCTYTEELISYTFHPEYLHEDSRLFQALLWFRPFYWLVCKIHKNEPKTYKKVANFNTTYDSGSDVIVAMVNSGDYTLSEAIFVYANACERCMNALAYKYLNGKDGYPEYSEEWKRCNTVCNWCRDE